MQVIAGLDHDRIVQWLARYVGEQDAEDVAQTAYMKAHQGAERFEGRSALTSWFYTIAKRCALDELRRRRRRPVTTSLSEPVDDVSDQVLEDTLGIPPSHDVAFLLTDDVVRRLCTLTPLQRDALLALVEHGDAPSAASALGVNPKAYKTRLARARRALREMVA